MEISQHLHSIFDIITIIFKSFIINNVEVAPNLAFYLTIN